MISALVSDNQQTKAQHQLPSNKKLRASKVALRSYFWLPALGSRPTASNSTLGANPVYLHKSLNDAAFNCVQRLVCWMEKLNREINAERHSDANVTSPEFATLIASEPEKWAKMIKLAGITVD
jgi:hypothetical protein